MKHLTTAYLILLTMAFAGCSTTSKLPEGEILYTGINSINYVDQGDKYRKGDAKYAGGVIVSIADAVDKISDAFTGSGTPAGDKAGEHSAKLGQKQRDSIRIAKEQENAVLETIKEELEAVFACAPNNSFFGSSYYRTPLPIGLWAYNAWSGSNKGLGHFLFKTFGSEPVLVSNVNPETRLKVADNVLRNYGYFHGHSDFSLQLNKKQNTARINYNIHTGRIFCIDTVEYIGFEGLADSLIQANISGSLLKKGVPFSAVTLSNEQSRIASMLRNEGFYYYRSSSATYKADTIAKPYRVLLRMQPKANIHPMVMKQWYIGKANISVLKNQGDTIQHEDKMRRDMGTYYYSGASQPVKLGVIFSNLLHRKGKLYSYDDQQKTEQLLGDIGIFSQMSLSYVPRDTTSACDTLDLWVNAVLDKRYSADFEVNVTERNSERIGPGMSLAIKKKNAFKHAEMLSFKIFGSYEWKTNLEKKQSSSIFNSYEAGVKVSLDVPRFVFPGMSPRRLRFPATTSISFSTDWLNRSGFYNMFSLGADLTYTWRRNNTSSHELTPISLSFDKLIQTTTEFDSILNVSPSLAVSMRDRFVPAMQYTYTYTSPASSRNPLTWQLTVKEAGALTSGICAISGESFSKKNKNIFNNPFAQFIKVSSEIRKSYKLGINTKLATRIMGGVAYSYGNTNVIPYNDQFYVGGANSVRAFTIRSVGPGRFVSRGRKYSYMDQTGDIKLEGNIELRFPLFGSLMGAWFVDAGNIWTMRSDETRQGGTFHLPDLMKDLALGSGAGLRYDLEFLVVRFDLGVALHDPASIKPGYFDTGSLSNRFALHFAIGYPF